MWKFWNPWTSRGDKPVKPTVPAPSEPSNKMDSATLQAAVGCDASHGDTYAPFMTEAMQKFGIGTTDR